MYGRVAERQVGGGFVRYVPGDKLPALPDGLHDEG